MSDTKPTTMHSIRRTSPKGQSFVGTCTLCGRSGLSLKAMSEPCENLRGLTQGEAVLEAITGEPTHE